MPQLDPTAPVRVLVVDDEPDFASLTADYLEREDPAIDPTIATGADTALELLDDEAIDCVVSDYDMPDTDGLELLGAIRESTPEMPFILFTGKGSEEIASRAISAGATDYLQKTGDPEQFERLANRIRHATSARRASQAVQETTAELRTIVESATDAIITIDADSVVQFANPAVEDVFGYPPEQVEGDPLTMLMPERLRDQHRNAIEHYLESGDRRLDWTDVELTGLHEDGHEVPLSISFGEFSHDGNRYFTGIIRDTTDRETREHELREAKAFTETALDSLDDLFFVFAVDGSPLQWNDRVTEVTGYTDDEIETKGPTAFFASEDAEYVEAAVEKCLRTGRASVDAPLVTADGDRIPYEFRARTLTDTEGDVLGFAGIGRDIRARRRRERRLAGLNDAIAEFLAAPDREAVCEVAVTAAADHLDLPVTAIALMDDEAGRLTPVATTDPAGTHLDLDRLLGPDGLAWDAYTAGEATAVPATDGGSIDASGTATQVKVYPLRKHGVLVTGVDGQWGPSRPSDDLIETFVANVTAALDRVEDDERHREREALLEEKNEWLERLSRINDVIRRIDRTLVSATTREEIEETVCSELVADAPFRFAWIGNVDAVNDRVTARASGGEGRGYLDDIDVTLDSGEDADDPVALAARTRDATVVGDILDDPPLTPWRKAAIDRGFRSCMAVPLTYRDRLYGVLAIYADRPDGFGELEREVLDELGDTIAHAINSIETTRALVSDEIVELAFEIDPASFPLFEPLGAHPSCTVSLESVMPVDGGTYRVFLTLHAATDDAIDAMAGARVVEELTVVADREDDVLVEADLSSACVVPWLLDHGAVPRALTIDGTGQLLVELTGDADVRAFVELLEETYPGSDLVARREHEREPRTRVSFLDELENRLTARQREALVTAYLSGFFDTPRQRTGEEIAASMGISQPTFSDHLRAAQRKLLDLLYADTDAPGPGEGIR